MKLFSILILSLAAATALMVGGCQKSASIGTNENAALGAAEPSQIEPNTAVMYVHGMACPQCAYNVDLQLLKVPGVTKVREVNMRSGRVVVDIDPENPPQQAQLAEAIRQTGFTLVRVQM